ncbi:MAG: hypothetical protein JWQ44_1002 [Chthoniobacter sp.]|jgi:hypothetical protein|nr:hypothetical protein [Chthoniobacter sp.]
MKWIARAVVVLLLSVPEGSFAQPPAAEPVPEVEIKGIREVVFDNWIEADGVFRIKWPSLRVTLRSSEDVKGDAIVGRAYFYDKDRKLISRKASIPKANHPDGSYGLPPLIKARTNIEAFIPIETAVKEAKWRTVLLVFGDRRKLTAEVYPRRDSSGWKDYDFPERERLLTQLKAEEEAKKTKTSLPPRPAPANL